MSMIAIIYIIASEIFHTSKDALKCMP